MAEERLPEDGGTDLDTSAAKPEGRASGGLPPNPDTSIREEVELREAQVVSNDRRDLEVTVIAGGLSRMGWYYTDEVLRAAVSLVEGAPAFADHPGPADRPERSVRDIVGYYRDARFVPGSQQSAISGQQIPATPRRRDPPEAGATGGAGVAACPDRGRGPETRDQGPETGDVGSGRIVATLHVLESAGWLWSLIREALAEGQPGLIGLSIDALGRTRSERLDGRPVRVVERLTRLLSVDLVTRPSAGGRIERILQAEAAGARFPAASQSAEEYGGRAARASSTGGGRTMADVVNSRQGTVDSSVREAGTEGRVDSAQGTGSSAQAGIQDSALGTGGGERETTDQRPETRLQAAVAEAERLLAEVREQRRAIEGERLLERELSASGLPEAVRIKLRRRFERQLPEVGEETLREAFDEERATLASLSAAGLITGMGAAKADISLGRDCREKLQTALDQLFDVPVPDALRLPPLGGIREAYVLATGDYDVSGHSRPDMIREAELTTSSFNYLLGTSMNKRLLQDYQAWPAEWQRFCSVVPIKDFKQQDRIRLGAFGSLSTVAEDTPYTELSLSDTRAIYTAAKRGNIVSISREVIVNDDLQAIKQIPTKLAVAAAYTLAEFVYGFLSGGRATNIYDGFPLFDPAAGPYNHGHNRRVDALATAAMQAGVTTMKEQTNMAGKRIGLKPAFLAVPPELEFTALVITRSTGLPGGNYNDVNPMMGYTEVIVSPQLSNGSEWYLAADPRTVDTIEIGFVGGQVNPTLLVQDQPLYGLNFTQDVITYKIRHEYGGAVVDYRGLYSGGS